jgi:hypothetical protein
MGMGIFPHPIAKFPMIGHSDLLKGIVSDLAEIVNGPRHIYFTRDARPIHEFRQDPLGDSRFLGNLLAPLLRPARIQQGQVTRKLRLAQFLNVSKGLALSMTNRTDFSSVD